MNFLQQNLSGCLTILDIWLIEMTKNWNILWKKIYLDFCLNIFFKFKCQLTQCQIQMELLIRWSEMIKQVKTKKVWKYLYFKNWINSKYSIRMLRFLDILNLQECSLQCTAPFNHLHYFKIWFCHYESILFGIKMHIFVLLSSKDAKYAGNYLTYKVVIFAPPRPSAPKSSYAS